MTTETTHTVVAADATTPILMSSFENTSGHDMNWSFSPFQDNPALAGYNLGSKIEASGERVFGSDTPIYLKLFPIDDNLSHKIQVRVG